MWNHWSLLQHIFFIKVQLKKVNLKIVFQRKYLKAHSQVRDNFWQLKVLYKLMKNAFHFTLKALFAIKIFKFLSWLFGYAKKWLDYKSTFNFKIYGKDNLAMKFGQLIEYNIFFNLDSLHERLNSHCKAWSYKKKKHKKITAYRKSV